MKTLALWLIFAVARPGYRYEFPRDHYAHPEFQTEWWYWTGNLKDHAGRRFGFELTFFRQAVSEDRAPKGVWDATDIYLAHLTLSDVATGRFLHTERVNRAGPGLAGATGPVWNGNWRADPSSLEAVAEQFSIRLKFSTQKPPVIHGVDGISRKAPGEGHASHYISFTRLETSGELTMEGKRFSVSGSSWMDHEFFTHQLTAEQTGWDWLSIQLEGGAELMLFRLRRKDGSIDPFSAGTYVDAAGKTRHLTAQDFELTPGERWKKYPVEWTIRVPSLQLQLRAATPMKNQELTLQSRFSPLYWEGVMDYAGTMDGRAVRGAGYLEMTGYEEPVRLGEITAPPPSGAR